MELDAAAVKPLVRMARHVRGALVVTGVRCVTCDRRLPDGTLRCPCGNVILEVLAESAV